MKNFHQSQWPQNSNMNSKVLLTITNTELRSSGSIVEHKQADLTQQPVLALLPGTTALGRSLLDTLSLLHYCGSWSKQCNNERASVSWALLSLHTSNPSTASYPLSSCCVDKYLNKDTTKWSGGVCLLFCDDGAVRSSDRTQVSFFWFLQRVKTETKVWSKIVSWKADSSEAR